ncbi:cysteine protease ATG4D-like [Hippocampus zosterae]|uniref:cysteine protease ATG4D-like n=1 Tax=Hippocampus zosterae TaxID=109293 RepID=UPI00223D1BA1|nr:cysteine protease ATG4D-like [Hippocampus zosterae]
MDRLKNTGTNLIYRVKSAMEGYSPSEEVVHLLGRRYDLGQPEEKTRFMESFGNRVWITYRKDLRLKADEEGLLNSDTGWGCMIRVGQMALAEALRRFFGLAEIKDHERLINIIGAFVDHDDGRSERGVYSIQKIAEKARKHYRTCPGEWYSPSTISFILKEIHDELPIKNGEGMGFEVFNNSMLYADQLVQAMTGQQACDCRDIICHRCLMKVPVKPVFFIVLCKVGVQKPLPDCVEVICRLLEHPCSLGMIGGRPGKAHYFLGKTHDNRLFFLDPHYVQSSTSFSELPEKLPSYFCDQIRSISCGSINPSIGLCFYVAELEQLHSLMETFRTLKGNKFLHFAKHTDPCLKRQREEERLKLESTRQQELPQRLDQSALAPSLPIYCP